MTVRLIAFLFTLCLPGISILHAQGCYQKALEKGERQYKKGEHEKARLTWEKGKQCPGADVAKLDEKIRMMDDFDLDGVPNRLDQCFYEFGAKETNGCPCADVYRRRGIDYYYDNKPDSALMQFNLAKNCGDTQGINDISAWETKIAEQKYAYDSTEQAGNGAFKVVTQNPDFPGGETSMLQFLFNNLRYPPYAKENGVEGIVYITFILEKDGNLFHIKVIRDIGAGLGEEAARVVRKMPPWNPGMMDGKPVRVIFYLPIKFKLE
ncbi:MAG: energy transducer TonB [Saprospiraceae bacterium]|nr:MAG: energy transducer TonB [Saprospiraceae bacterium]